MQTCRCSDHGYYTVEMKFSDSLKEDVYEFNFTELNEIFQVKILSFNLTKCLKCLRS